MKKHWLALALALLPASAFAQGLEQTVAPPTVFPSVDGNSFNVKLENAQLFWDDFGTGTLDTTNRWSTPTTGGGGNATAATNAVGATVLGSGNQANGFSQLISQPTFAGRNPGYVTLQFQVNWEFPVLSNAYRFFGFFSAPGTPTAAAPLTNAVGFVIDTAGKLRAQTWASGAINVNIDLSVRTTGPQFCNCIPQPTDAGVHKYQIYFRGDSILWFVDGNFVAEVLTGAGGPDVNTLAIGALTVAAASPPTSSATLQLNQVTIGDSSRNATAIRDGTFGWRQATVSPLGALNTTQGTVAAGSGSAGFPPGSTPVTAVFNAADTTTATATLAAVAAKFTYICGFNITGLGATAATSVTPTITGLPNAFTFTGAYTFAAGAAVANAPVSFSFGNYCLPSSAVNTAVVVTVPGAAGNTATSINAWGYQQ